MKIGVYAEHCVRGGDVCIDEEKVERGGDDLVVYEGDEAELKATAKDLMVKRPCGWNWRAGASILEYLR